MLPCRGLPGVTEGFAVPGSTGSRRQTQILDPGVREAAERAARGLRWSE
jgi:hypothetical protein